MYPVINLRTGAHEWAGTRAPVFTIAHVKHTHKAAAQDVSKAPTKARAAAQGAMRDT